MARSFRNTSAIAAHTRRFSGQRFWHLVVFPIFASDIGTNAWPLLRLTE